MQSSSLYFLASAYLCLNVAAECFYPNGTAATDVQQPCNDSGHSMCCLLNPESGSGDADVCTKDGLCIPSYNGWLFRDTCTDSTWQDPACLNICMTGKTSIGTDIAGDYAAITTCADGSLCCGVPGNETSGDCCQKRKGQWLVDGKLTDIKPASLSATQQTTAATAASTSAPTAVATPTPESSSSNNTGAIVGGVVGGIAGVVLLGLLFWWFMIRRSLAQRRNQPQVPSYEPYSQSQMPSDQKYWQPTSEAPVQGHFRGELDTDNAQRAPELDSAQVK